MRLGELLIKKGLINEDKLQVALSYQKVTDTFLGEALIKLNFVSSYEIARTLAEQAGIPFIDLTEFVVSDEAIKLVPKETAERMGLIPLRIDNDYIEIGMHDPSNLRAIDNIAKAAGRQVKVFMIDRVSFNETLERAYFFLANPIRQRINEAIEAIKTAESLPTGTIAEMTEHLIMEGIRQKSTDIHITPTQDIINIFFRVDGVLQHGFCIPISAHKSIVSRIKVQSMLDIAEQRLPQDGAFSMTFLNAKYEMRVSTTPTIHGENIVIRVLAGTGQLLKLDTLGFDDNNTKRLCSLFQKPHGIILITGPTGSGKTTTLYAALREVNLMERNVLTVEDPVEYRLNFVKQTSVNLKAGYDFALAGRNFMRQDPDVMLLGEIRDEETAKIAIRASITGHLVLSTLHTNDAVTSIPRLLDFDIDRFMLSSSLLAVIAQRLIRKLCIDCKEEYIITEEELDPLSLNGNLTKYDIKLDRAFRAKGCTLCNDSGYVGRTVVGEVMVVNDSMKEMISDGSSLSKLKEAALANGMIPLKIAGLRLVEKDITSIEEVVRLVN
jgi:type II secretory ATPase GspE/PulE/Tfp pilus assembly ATPase PilB-like protein